MNLDGHYDIILLVLMLISTTDENLCRRLINVARAGARGRSCCCVGLSAGAAVCDALLGEQRRSSRCAGVSQTRVCSQCDCAYDC